MSHDPTHEDHRPAVQELFAALKVALPTLQIILDSTRDHWGEEDRIYRFYHQSFKVFYLQEYTTRIVAVLRGLQPSCGPDPAFARIIEAGTGKEFKMEDNEHWEEVTRPILEAYFHAKYFLEMAVKYGEQLEYPPNCMPSGWAALLYLYGLR